MENLIILTPEEIKEKLKSLPGWEYTGGKLVKTFEFKEFLNGIHLVDELAFYSESINHHPDIFIEHRKIKFELWRFDIGMKVTNYDFMVAHKIEELYKKYSN